VDQNNYALGFRAGPLVEVDSVAVDVEGFIGALYSHFISIEHKLLWFCAARAKSTIRWIYQ
jgi:hypothetical protein